MFSRGPRSSIACSKPRLRTNSGLFVTPIAAQHGRHGAWRAGGIVRVGEKYRHGSRASSESRLCACRTAWRPSTAVASAPTMVASCGWAMNGGPPTRMPMAGLREWRRMARMSVASASSLSSAGDREADHAEPLVPDDADQVGAGHHRLLAHVPAGPAEELHHHRQAQPVLLARHLRQQGARAGQSGVVVAGRTRGSAGA